MTVNCTAIVVYQPPGDVRSQIIERQDRIIRQQEALIAKLIEREKAVERQLVMLSRKQRDARLTPRRHYPSFTTVGAPYHQPQPHTHEAAAGEMFIVERDRDLRQDARNRVRRSIYAAAQRGTAHATQAGVTPQRLALTAGTP